MRILGWTASALLVLSVLLPVGVYALSATGIGNERLRSETEAVLSRLAGRDIEAAIGQPYLSVGPSRFLSVEVNDVRIVDATEPGNLIEAGKVRFGVRVAPLLSGDVKLGSASIEDARISIASMPEREGVAWTTRIAGPDGLFEPELVMSAIFASLRHGFDSLDRSRTSLVELGNVDVLLPATSPIKLIHIESGRAEREESGALRFELAASVDGRPVSIAGSAERDDAGLIAGFKATAMIVPTYADGPFSSKPVAGREFVVMRIGGGLSVAVEGKESGPSPRLAVTATLTDGVVGFSGGDVVEGSGVLVASMVPEGRKLEIERADLNVGRSTYRFHGAVGPSPADTGVVPHYRFELVSDGSTVAPGGSPEPDLPILARVAGSYDPAARRLTADEIGVRTSAGEISGKAVISFVEGSTPGLDLVLSVAELPVGHTKQLWPWFAAKSAKAWADKNLFGGMVRNSRLSLSSPPGRIGSGIPLTRNEINGHFEVEGTRFDISGDIPPVRDGSGVIDFRGTDVDVAFRSGTVYMPTGRTAAASDGTLTIRNAHVRPVIGDLDIGIAGSADELAELATYKPIDAMKRLPILPEDLSGSVTGRVKARIPFQKNVDVAELGWTVSLAYDNLSIAKPFENQSLSDASGTIVVDRHLAVIKAKGKLNGMDAELDIAEPIDGSVEDRRRDVTLLLDENTQKGLVPGLSGVLSGPVKVKVSGTDKGRNRVTADLTAARLALPWVGWTKGPGIAASATLSITTDAGTTRIDDFRLTGKSFEIAGQAIVGKEGLTSAKFSSVRLNRTDDVSMEIRRAGGGYRIDVKGKGFDARSLIKQLLGDPERAAGTAKSLPITLSADVASVSGFDGETISGMKIEYKGTGARIGDLTLSGQTRSGAAVSATNSTGGGRRAVQMQSSDAGALLRFLDIYPHMQGGRISLNLAAQGDGPLVGQIDARDFALVDEPRLRSIVSTPSDSSPSLNQAVRRDIDTSRVQFERGFAQIEKGTGFLNVKNGVLRGPLIGTTFQGAVYDRNGKIAITGTFMPAYGLNRLFAEIPLLGQILGNGRDRGLIGITYRVAGDAKTPQVEVNPISAIAPGIFRSIFEYN